MEGLTDITISSSALVTLPSGIFTGMTALVNFQFGNNGFLTNLPSDIFSGLTALQNLNLTGDGGITTPPALTGLTALQYLSFNNTHITTLGTGIFDVMTSLNTVYFAGNTLDAASVNNVLASLVVCCTSNAGSLDLSGGTNAPPSGQGILDAQALTVAGWSVTTNTASLPITGVNQVGKTFTVAGNQTSYFPTGSTFTVSGSTGNDGTYTVVSATFGTSTDVVVVEAIPDATVDGSITAL
jgi:hypothetical protein